MIEYQEILMQIEDLTSDRVSLGRRNIQLRLMLTNNLKGLILNLQNIFYFLNNLCNLVSFDLFKDNGIFHSKKVKTLYKIKITKHVIQAQC